MWLVNLESHAFEKNAMVLHRETNKKLLHVYFITNKAALEPKTKKHFPGLLGEEIHDY